MIGSDGGDIGIIMIPGANYPGERYIPLGRYRERWRKGGREGGRWKVNSLSVIQTKAEKKKNLKREDG